MAQLNNLAVVGETVFVSKLYVPTPAQNNNTQKIATTAFVKAAIDTAIKAVSGK